MAAGEQRPKRPLRPLRAPGEDNEHERMSAPSCRWERPGWAGLVRSLRAGSTSAHEQGRASPEEQLDQDDEQIHGNERPAQAAREPKQPRDLHTRRAGLAGTEVGRAVCGRAV